MSSIPTPSFEDLFLNKSGPEYNAWGRFGENDQLGMLNLLTPENTKAAATHEIREGTRVSLDWYLHEPAHPFFGRQVFYHHIDNKAPRSINDDILMFNTQCSTQWDGFRHFGYQDARQFYGGHTQDDFSKSDVLGNNVWVEKGGIVGRGILLDYASWAEKHNIQVDCLTQYSIPAQHLEQLMEEEKITTRPGDIVFIRSGFIKAYEALSVTEEAALPSSKGRQVIGVEPTLDMARWVWKHQFAAIAGDMPGFERAPDIPGADEPLHQWLLAGWGLPIGEMFYLEELARECKRLGRHTFFVTSVPLKVRGGVASPPNAIAIL